MDTFEGNVCFVPENIGELVLLEPGDPAAGASLVYTIPTGFVFELITLRYQYETDGNAANRYNSVNFRTPVPGDYFLQVNALAQTANLTWRWHYSRGDYITGVLVSAEVMASIPNHISFAAGSQIVIDAVGMQGADQISDCRIFCRRWRTVA